MGAYAIWDKFKKDVTFAWIEIKQSILICKPSYPTRVIKIKKGLEYLMW